MIAKRDFVLKILKFESKGRTYIYFSSVSPSVQQADDPKNTATQVTGFFAVERDLADNRVKLTYLSQAEYALKGTLGGMAKASIIGQFPKMMEAWFKRIQTHLGVTDPGQTINDKMNLVARQ